MNEKNLIYVAGPTAVGKTKLSVALAKTFNTEIISCDSRQFYKEMTIGTAVPSMEERDGVPHHFIQHKFVKDIYTVGDYEKDALALTEKLFKKNDTLIMVGGSGMYADAIMFGLDEFPPIPKEVREQLNLFRSTHGIESLQVLLREKDPDYYRKVDRNNPQRLIRALEVCIAADKPYSSFLGKEKKSRPFVSKMLILHCPRKILYENINQRVDHMMANGLEEEVKNNIDLREHAPLKTIGYKELIEYFDGNFSLEKAVDNIKRNTRRYAKRQITWFKKYDNAFCFPANTPVEEVYELLNQ
jgi:tRNA dimethylallyltransferase